MCDKKYDNGVMKATSEVMSELLLHLETTRDYKIPDLEGPDKVLNSIFKYPSRN